MGYASYLEDIIKIRDECNLWEEKLSQNDGNDNKTIDLVLTSEERFKEVKNEWKRLISKIYPVIDMLTSPEYDVFTRYDQTQKELFDCRKRVDELVKEQSMLLSKKMRDEEILKLKSIIYRRDEEMIRLKKKIADNNSKEFERAMSGTTRSRRV